MTHKHAGSSWGYMHCQTCYDYYLLMRAATVQEPPSAMNMKLSSTCRPTLHHPASHPPQSWTQPSSPPPPTLPATSPPPPPPWDQLPSECPIPCHARRPSINPTHCSSTQHHRLKFSPILPSVSWRARGGWTALRIMTTSMSE